MHGCMLLEAYERSSTAAARQKRMGTCRVKSFKGNDARRSCACAGARNMGLDSLFVAGGIHAAELGIAPDSAWEPDREDLDALLYKHNARPTMMMAVLQP